MLHSLERHLHLFVLLFLSVIHVCFGWNYVSMLDIGRAVENAQWLLLLQKQQCLVLERTGFGIVCRNDMSKMQTFWRSQHPPPIQKQFLHEFPRHWAMRDPIHFSRFVLRGHNCSKLFQSWSWVQEEKGGPFPQAVATFKVQTFPKRIRPLIKPLLKNSFATNFQGTGPWEGPIHFSRFVLRVHNCSKLFQSWSWSQEKKEKPFTKAIAKFKAQTFPKKIRPLTKPLLKNSFSTNFQGTGPWEGPIHFSRFVLRGHNCSKLFQSWSWSQEKKEKPFTKAIPKFKAQTFPKRIRPLIKPLLKNSFSTNFQRNGPWEGPIHFSRLVRRVRNCSKLFQSWSWIQEEKGGPFPQAVAKFKAQTFPKITRLRIKSLFKNSFSTNFQRTGPWEGPIHFSRFVRRVRNCSKLFQSWSWSQERKEKPFTKAIAKFKAQTFPKRTRPRIKSLLKNSFATNFQGTGPWEGPIHFSRFVPRVHNCSKLFQSWSWSQEKKEAY